MIFGIDPAAKSLAISAWGSGITATYKITTKKDDRWRQILELQSQLNPIIDLWNPDAIFIEEPVVAGAGNIRSTILIAETVGMVLSCGLPTYLVPVSSWKKKTVGNGNATKQEVAEWIEKELPEYAALCKRDQDLLDAGAIGEYGRQVMEALGHDDVPGEG